MASGGPPDLSKIDPGLLMSAAGRNEYEGARQLAGPLRGRTQYASSWPVGPTAGTTVTDDARTMLEEHSFGPPSEDVYSQQPIEPEEDIDLGGDEDWTGLAASQQQHQRHNARVARTTQAMDQVDLAAMWMQGTGIPFDPGQLVAPGGDGFEFDTGEMAVDAAYPRGGGGGGARFRVDGPAPQRQPFNRTRVDDGGVEIGRIGRGGRFEGRPPSPPAPPAPTIFEQVRVVYNSPRPPPPPEPPRPPVSAVQQAREMQSRSKGPSVYDLIRSNPLRK